MSASRITNETIGSIMASNRGITSGFDYMRIGLAIAVVCWHSILTTQGGDREIWSGIWRPLPAVILPMFFCLSGFLVAGSLFRTPRISEFLMLRAIRLLPALFVEIVLCALILGPLLTTVPLREYFSGTAFHEYFLNIFGMVYLYLPGLFPNNPFPDVVNINLRTLPAELECYILLASLAVLKISGRRMVMALLACALMLLATFYYLPRAELLQATPPTSASLILAFLFGVVFYINRDQVPHSRLLFVIALVLTVILLGQAWSQHLALPFLAYVTVYLGLKTPAKRTFLLRGDYSYGLYLFGFPMQQVYAMLFMPHLHWLGSIAFALVFGLGYAWFSWNYVEKPVLQRKNQIIAAANAGAGKVRAVVTLQAFRADKAVMPVPVKDGE